MSVTEKEVPKSVLSELTFSASRASGPGGQNVNKVNSKMELRWTPAASRAVLPAVRSRFLELYGRRLTTEGELIISSGRHREQGRNREDCLERLATMIASALRPPKRRKKTRVPEGVKRHRRDEKRKRSARKAARRSQPAEYD